MVDLRTAANIAKETTTPLVGQKPIGAQHDTTAAPTIRIVMLDEGIVRPRGIMRVGRAGGMWRG